MEAKKKYLESLNWFRGIAIIFVFLTHIPKEGMSDSVAHFVALFFGNGTFFFMFISGYLFWHLKDRYDYISYLETKFKNVILPYLFISLPVLIMAGVLGVGAGGSKEVLLFDLFSTGGVLWHLLVGGMGINVPMWFIPMICLFFFTSPIIYGLAESKYFSCVFALSMVFSLLSFRPDSLQYPIYSYFHFFGVYLLGIFCKKHEGYIFENAKWIASVSFVLYLLLIVLDYNYSSYGIDAPKFYPMFTEQLSIKYVNLNQLQKLFGVLFILALLFFIESNGRVRLPFLDMCAKYSFGVFFVHYYWIVLFNIALSELPYSVVVVSCLSFIFSLGSVFIFKSVLSKFRADSRVFIGC